MNAPATHLDDFLRADDLDPAGLAHVLALAAELKLERRAARAAGRAPRWDVLRGRTIATIFEKPSLRTRVSFEVAITELGGAPIKIDDDEILLGRRETVADTARVLEGFVDGIVLRTFGQDRLDELAEHAGVPVVNALSDLEHPCQALADLQTVAEVHTGLDGTGLDGTGADRTGLAGLALAYVGDGNNVANSLLLAGATAGMHVTVVHPDGHAPDAASLARAETIAASTGGRVAATTDLGGVEGAQAVYTDVWTSMGQEVDADRRAATFEPYRVDDELMGAAGPDAVFLHCLPAHRGEEVTASVIDGPRSRVHEQAENRLHAQKALLAVLYGAAGTRAA